VTTARGNLRVMTGGENGAARLPDLDTSRPSIARVYDYWLGGTDNFEADRQEAERLLRVYPGLDRLARENRLFLRRAVHWLATDCGIRQFLDIGSGLPTASNTHEVAQAAVPDSRVAYVDNDPMVVLHAAALLADGRDVIAVRGNAAVAALPVSMQPAPCTTTAPPRSGHCSPGWRSSTRPAWSTPCTGHREPRLPRRSRRAAAYWQPWHGCRPPGGPGPDDRVRRDQPRH
jgi:hypothetical protein